MTNVCEECRVLSTQDQTEWLDVLGRVEHYDVFHLPQFHRVEEQRLGAKAHLFTYREGDYLIALPLLLRPIDGEPHNDATSVYGYGGPLPSHQRVPESVVENFQQALKGAMLERGVVSVFSRMHPLLEGQGSLLAGLGEYRPNGQTVSIDLTLPPEQQLAQYRRSHRQRMKNENGLIYLHDEEKRYFGEFVDIYEETMRRVNATRDYFFGKDYFDQLRDQLGTVLQLFVALSAERVVAASLFTVCDGIVQFYLSGTRTEFLKPSPMTTILDRARTTFPGYALHLGGGLGGSNEDSLFHYKAGFSGRRHDFATWRWIVQPDIYQQLCRTRTLADKLKRLEPISTNYFPEYRCPAVPIKVAERRIYLSPPHMGEAELELVKEAFASNWIAPIGPHIDAFEREFSDYLGAPHAAAVCSGTAAIHLAVRLLGVQPGDEVLCPTLTFAASANPIVYEHGVPVFIDSESSSWNMDPDLLRAELDACAERGRLPKAVIVVDLYGQSADYDPIVEACAHYNVPLIQDSAEALGASYKGHKLGTQGRFAAFSFNGNKIITTSGGGMLVSSDAALIERARFLATQARDPAPHYQHSAIGCNYRLSNVLAGIGRGQLRVLPERVAARKSNFEQYKAALESVPGIKMMPIAAYGEPNYWLTCILIDAMKFGASCEEVRLALEAANIEARPIWKPLHLQPVFARCRVRGGKVAASIFERGLCLPSGSSLTGADIERICSIILTRP